MPHPEGEALHDHETIRWMVGRILKNGYITEADKREFYLSQIDLVPSPPINRFRAPFSIIRIFQMVVLAF